jgi:hypothetical protein
MKKLIFTALAVGAISSAFAQQKIDNRNDQRFKAENRVSSPANGTFGKTQIPGWFSPTRWAEAAGASSFMKTYVQFVMPDSLVKYIDEADTIRRPYNISYGQIIDPKDDNIDLTDDITIKMNKWTGYTVDSINMIYLYVRNVDTKIVGGNTEDVVDTLIINYFTVPNNGIKKNTLVGSGELVAYPGWSVPSLMPTTMIATQKIPLTRDDSTFANNNNGGFENSWRLKQKTFAAPAGITVASKGVADNLIGYTINFKLGHDYDSNSVMIYQRDPVAFPITNARSNYFGYSLAINEGTTEQQVEQTKFYTNALFTTKASAYTASGGSSWSGYIPGNAYFESQYAETDAHLTSLNTAVKEIKNDNFAMTNVYPNPATVNGTAVMGFNLKTASVVTVKVLNIAGQQVKTVINKNFSAGEHAEEFDLAGLKPGIYMVNMTVNGVSATKKLTITE